MVREDDDSDKGLNGPGRGTVSVAGLTIGYRIVGTGPTLLLICGFGSPIGLWQEELLTTLAERFRVIMYDHRGVGQSDFTNSKIAEGEGKENEVAVDAVSGITLADMADDAAGLLLELGIPKAYVLGWSMGGLVAEEFALRHPEKVDRLILYAAHCSDTLHPPTSKVIDDICKGSDLPEIETSLKFVCMLFPDEWVKENYGRIRMMFGPPLGNVPVAVLRRQVKAIEDWEGSCHRLHRIRAPTLLIHGELDILTPVEESRVMAEVIPDSRLEVVEGVGHGLMFQDPETFVGIVVDFLS